MDHETDKQEPSGTEGREMKVGDKVWVEVTVLDISQNSVLVRGYADKAWWMRDIDCKPVEPEASKKLNTVTFGIGDPVVSYDGRRGVVEAINVVDEFPITVRHSMREQVSYKFCGVKHDDDPMGKDPVIKQPLTSTSDPVNPSHYKQGGIECIEAIKAALLDGFDDYLVGNIIKYIWRRKWKNGVEDLKKARWYLDRLIQEEEAK
jgi:hypothetical protein